MPSDWGSTVCGAPREHHVQLFLPAPLKAEFRCFEGLEALHCSARDQARALGDVQKTIGIRNQFEAYRLAGIQDRGEIGFAGAAQMLMRTPRRGRAAVADLRRPAAALSARGAASFWPVTERNPLPTCAAWLA